MTESQSKNIPFFSIVTAIKDGLSFFKKTAPTILAQTYTDFEWIIVDDSSSDPVSEYVATLNDPRIRLMKSTEPGQTKSLNQAIKQSRSEWIVRMDADDIAVNSRLQLTKDAIHKNPSASLFFSNYQVIDENDVVLANIEYKTPLSENFFKYLKINNPICHPTVCFRKHSVHGEIHLFDERLNNAQDYALWKKFAKESKNSIFQIDAVLLQYRIVRQSLSGARAPEQAAELEKIRNNFNTNQLHKTNPIQNQKLNPSAQNGMLAFRIAYYRFLSTTSFTVKQNRISLLTDAMQHPKIFLKTLFFILAVPLRSLLKPFLFNGIYK